MSAALVSQCSSWEAFEAACGELHACLEQTEQFCQVQLAELDHWEQMFTELAARPRAVVAIPGPVAETNDNSAAADLLARLESLCASLERHCSATEPLPLVRTNTAGQEGGLPTVDNHAEAPPHNYVALSVEQARLRRLAEQVLTLERVRCTTTAELAALRRRTAQLVRRLKRRHRAFKRERQRWLRRITAIERALQQLRDRDMRSSHAFDNECASRERLSQNPGDAKLAADELLVEAILARSTIGPDRESPSDL